MDSPTQTITTPITQAAVVIKDWITGADAEYIDDALYEAIEAKGDGRGGMGFGKFDPKSIKEQSHREIERFIVSVGGVTDGVVGLITAMPEEDYAFVRGEITSRRKKKVIPQES